MYLIYLILNYVETRGTFRSTNIHPSADGERVVNYAQWDSERAFRAMLDNPQAREHREATTRLAHAEPRLYGVASVHHH